MPRPLRIEYEHACYHVMNRGRGRKAIYHDPHYYQAFLLTITEAVQRFSMILHAYCLMGNHYHLLIETPEGNLSRIMRHINGVYTQRYNRLKKSDGPLFRGRYKAIVIDNDAYLLQLSRYIHRNPIETQKPLVRKLEQYPWSSYCAYIDKSKPPHWLTCQTIYDMLGQKAGSYQAYVEFGDDEDLQRFYGKKNPGSILGDKKFRETVLARNKTHLEQPQLKRIKKRPALNLIVQTVANIFNVDKSVIIKRQTGRQPKNTARKVAMYLAQQLCDLRLQEIREKFGVNHIGSISNSVSEIKQRIGKDSKLKKKVNQVIDMIQRT